MKKKVIDELNNIHEELIEKSIEIDSKEKLAMAKKGEKEMKKGVLFKWLLIGATCVFVIFIGSYLGLGSIFKNENTNPKPINRTCPTGYILEGNNCIENKDPDNNEGENTENAKQNKFGEVVIEAYPLLSNLKIKTHDLEDFDLYFMKLNNDGKNKVYSPLSIKYALEMLSEGAKGETKAQIDAILGSYNAGKYINSQHMSFANAFFANEDAKDSIKQTYINNLKDKFNASVVYDTFESADNVNNWISKKTLGLINDLLTDEDVKGKFFAIVNALAIDMEWVNPIQPYPDENKNELEQGYIVTYDNENASLYIGARDVGTSMDFNAPSGKIFASAMEFGSIFNNYDIIKELGENNIRKTVTNAYNEWLKTNDIEEYVIKDFDKYLDDYIKDLKANYHKSGNSTDYRFYTDENVKVFAKDLKKYNGTQLEYIQIMPTKQELDNYIKSLNASKLKKLINELKETKYQNFKEGVVTIINGYTPAFNYETTINLVDNLNKLGIYDLFVEGKADLSGITDAQVFVDSAIHTATIDLSNDGIKAAAVTFIGGAGDDDLSFRYSFDVPVEKIDLTFDKPFIYIIRDKVTGEVWFAGSVYEPTNIDDLDWEAIEKMY